MTDEFDPLTGELLPKSTRNAAPQSSISPLSAEEIRNICANPESISALCLERLVEIVANGQRTTALTPVIKELMDRNVGKAPQSIAMTVEARGIDKLSDERLLALERELARMTGQDAVIIPPLPQKLIE